MKKIAPLILSALLLGAACAACTAEESASPGSSAPPVSASASACVQAPAWTEEEILALFQSREALSGCEATDCVVASDSAYGLVGVVQYTDAQGGPCHLAFLEADGAYQTVGLDAEGLFAVAEGSALTYLGDGAVMLTLQRKATGGLSTYTMQYTKDETGVTFTAEDLPQA